MTRTHQPVEHHKGSDGSQPVDPQATAQNLLNDAQGRWFNGSKPEAVKKLVDQGILPKDSQVLDFSTVQDRLKKDQNEFGDIKDKKGPDTTESIRDLGMAKLKQAFGQKNIDGVQGDIDKLQLRIDGVHNMDAQTKKDADAVSKALNKDFAYHSDLSKLAKDDKQPPEVREAAQRLLDTWKKAGPRGAANSDYAKDGWLGQYVNQDSVDAGIAKHEKGLEKDKSSIAEKTTTRDKLKENQKGLDGAVDDKQTALNKLEQEGKDLEARKKKLADNIQGGQDALKPSADLDKAGRVISGGGYYQVAEKLLGLNGKGHSNDQERELKMLTKLLQDEARQSHGGKLPPYLKANDPLLREENLNRIMDKIAAMTKASK